MTLVGKRYLVTGVASGIGASTAQALVDAGAIIIGMDLKEPEVPCESFLTLDQGDPSSIDAAVGALNSRLDGVCNIAGVPPTADVSPVRVLMVNFFGLRRLTLGLADRLNDGAAIVNVASAAGLGWMGLVLPEKYGGSGMCFQDLTVLLEEIGLACLPCRGHQG